MFIHASAVRFQKKGVLLLGPSTSGKSDLALRLIDAGAVLIADDQVRLSLDGDRLHAGPPQILAGLIELRGMGIMRVPFEEGALDLVVDLKPAASAFDPLPEPASMSWLGVDLPKIELDATAPSAVARIKMALNAERVF
ncbi:MAG: HPr kinase/phosphatase C-terminal domain-containing protein [Pseudomonadota bacterium]